MFKIYPNGIVATKGDTVRMNVIVTNNDGTVYDVQDMDEITFHLKETYEDEDCIIELTVDNDDLLLLIPHEETMKLEVGKTYVYELKIKKENEDILTFVQGKMKVTNSVCNK